VNIDIEGLMISEQKQLCMTWIFIASQGCGWIVRPRCSLSHSASFQSYQLRP